jgi:hypothetical protein
MSDSDKPSGTYSEWLRRKVWSFTKRERDREGADSVMPHLEEFQEQSKLLGKRVEDKDRERRLPSDKEKPPH